MSAESEEDREKRKFDPILRQLIFHQLVEPSVEGGARGWRLVPAASERLSELSSPPPAGDKVVYFSHHCARCRRKRPTRRREEQYVCEECWTAPATVFAGQPAAPLVAPAPGAAGGLTA